MVAGEIHRVLRPRGIVYADSPFIQQICEGPYDLTRFTDSGQRYLFRRFERIDSGSVAGAGTALRWSIDYFVRALTRSRRLGRLAVLCFFWLSWMDRILDPKHTIDGACSVFFLGRKTKPRSARPTSSATTKVRCPTSPSATDPDAHRPRRRQVADYGWHNHTAYHPTRDHHEYLSWFSDWYPVSWRLPEGWFYPC